MPSVAELEDFLKQIVAENPGMTRDEALGVVVELVAEEIKHPDRPLDNQKWTS